MTTTALIPLAADTLVAYEFRTRQGSRIVCGRKGRPVNPGQSAGFELLSDDGDHVAYVSRYAKVTVLDGPRH